MKVRGERECRECGTHWSYYETGSIECPACGSVRSVGLDERTTHTDTPVELDLSDHRSRFGEARETLPDDHVEKLKGDLREYTRRRGFIRAGELLPLDPVYLAARELLETVDVYDRLRDPTDIERKYLLSLLGGVTDGVRPPAADVPESVREARGMAAVHSVEAYRSDLLSFLDEQPFFREQESDETSNDAAPNRSSAPNKPAAPNKTSNNATRTGSKAENDDFSQIAESNSDTGAPREDLARDAIEQLRDRTKLVEALGGDVSPGEADALVDAADAIGEFVRDGEHAALTRARDELAKVSNRDS